MKLENTEHLMQERLDKQDFVSYSDRRVPKKATA